MSNCVAGVQRQDGEASSANESADSSTITTGSSSTLFQVNTSTGAPASLLEKIYEKHNNSTQAINKRKERRERSDRVQETSGRLRALTSGKIFAKGVVALHSAEVLEHQMKVLEARDKEEEEKRKRGRDRVMARKANADKIRAKRQLDTDLTATELRQLIIYKRTKKDKSLKSFENLESLLGEWRRIKGRESPAVEQMDGIEGPSVARMPTEEQDSEVVGEIERVSV